MSGPGEEVVRRGEVVGHILLLLIVTVLINQISMTTGVREDGERLICLDTGTRFHSTQV